MSIVVSEAALYLNTSSLDDAHASRDSCCRLVLLFYLVTARRYASSVYAVSVCPSVCLSVRLSQTGTVPKALNVRSRKQTGNLVF